MNEFISIKQCVSRTQLKHLSGDSQKSLTTYFHLLLCPPPACLPAYLPAFLTACLTANRLPVKNAVTIVLEKDSISCIDAK